MSCILGNGVALGCKDSLGGVKEVYIASYTNLETYTYEEDAADANYGSITAIANSGTFYRFEMRQEQGEFIQTGVHNPQNGTNYWEQNASLVFTKNEAVDRNTLLVLAQSTLLVIVLDQNGFYWIVGEKNGAELIESSQSAGKAYSDLNGSTLTIQGKEATPSRKIDAAVIPTLPGLVPVP